MALDNSQLGFLFDIVFLYHLMVDFPPHLMNAVLKLLAEKLKIIKLNVLWHLPKTAS